MYTQCSYCKAVFQVDMKDVTTAQGKLKCGECLHTFNAVESLSTSKPDKPLFSNITYKKEEIGSIAAMDDWQSYDATNSVVDKDKSKQSDTIYLASLFLLTFLLVAQILYQNPSLFSDAPAKREADKIEMLNYNVFAHPTELGVLLISGAIQNNAEHTQPFPTLEITLTDKQTNIVGLSRFHPREYLPKTIHKGLMPKGMPVSLNLKIKDPGNNATHFKFNFK